ncbi:MAG TPA: hypothetical protein VNW50_03850 [Streptosporangiaceae bacterium]|nr:hypothetical protein [Streptosporangiaceae bacterium]
MTIVVTYLAYLLISVGLTFLVGQVLWRSGRIFLLDALDGSDGAASGISRLNVVTFYLISLGFVALTMRTSGGSITARQAIELLVTKIGEVLLVLAALYLASIVVLTRLRRRLSVQAEASAAAPSAGPQGTPARKSASPAGPPAAQVLWRPAPRRTAQ